MKRDIQPDYFAAAFAPARTTVWHWLAGFTAILVLTVLGTMATVFPAYALMPESWMGAPGDGRFGGFGDYLVLFLVFIPAFVLPLVIFKTFNALPWRRLITAAARIRWGHMGRAFGVVMIAYILWSGADYLLFPDGYEEMQVQTDWTGFAVLVLITLLLCPIQAASEEILLRGYANLMLVRVFGSKRAGLLAAFVLTSAGFAALHLGNPEADGQVWPYMLGTFNFGLAMCALTQIEGGLESAIGYHIGNNIFVFSLFGYADPTLPDSAMFWVPEIAIGYADVAQEGLVMVGLVALILWLNRRADACSRVA